MTDLKDEFCCLKWSNDTCARFYKKYYRLLACGDFEINRRHDLETRKSLVLHLQLNSPIRSLI